MTQWIRIHLSVEGTQVPPWSGKIPHFLEQLSLCATTEVQALQSPKATTTEPTCCNYQCLRA